MILTRKYYNWFKYFKLILTSILLIFFINSQSQSLLNLEKQKKKKENEIKYTNDLINQTKKEKRNSYNQLLLINKKINTRKELITNIESEITGIDSKILNNDKSIKSLEYKLDELKKEYAKMIYFAYKNSSSYNKLLFIFSAKDFNSSYMRLKYLQQYSQNRQKQAQLIINTRDSIQYLISDLHNKKVKKEVLVTDHKTQTVILSNEKQNQNKVISSLKSKEQELKKKLKAQQVEYKKMQKAIDDVIAEEARKAAERARLEAELKAKENEAKKLYKKKSTNKKDETNNTNVTDDKTNTNTNTKTINYALTSEDQINSDNFGKNKGNLPWPTERGVITGTFGEHEHPVLKGVKIKNDGITISTSQGSSARAIFDGVVSRVISIPGINNVVIIRHGDYLTVYKNLTVVNVNSGDKVKAKQNIGTIYTDEDGKTAVDIQIWKGNIKLNPSLWLSH